MKIASAQKLDIEIVNAGSVSALLDRPPKARACFVFAHGAGAGMTHPFMETVASGLRERGIATLRYQFPYMEKGSKLPDPPAIAQAAVRAAVAEAARRRSISLPPRPGGVGRKGWRGKEQISGCARGLGGGEPGIAGVPGMKLRHQRVRGVNLPKLALRPPRPKKFFPCGVGPSPPQK